MFAIVGRTDASDATWGWGAAPARQRRHGSDRASRPPAADGRTNEVLV
jgi:hypothetical protein